MSDSYIGRKACGCVVAAVVDRPGFQKDTANTVASFIRSGLTVERMTTEEVRRALGPCVHQSRASQLGMVDLT